MKTSPVSFGSLMCFTIDDGKPKVPVHYMVAAAFQNNPILQGYNLQEDLFDYNANNPKEKIDGTVHNAAADFCEKLDKLHKSKLPKGSNSVIITKADFYVNPRDTQPRYFITAPTSADENKILLALCNSRDFYTARFGPKGN